MAGCKTNAITNEEPRSNITTVNAKVMVDELDGQSMDDLFLSQTRGGRKLLLVLCVQLEEEIELTRQGCCT